MIHLCIQNLFSPRPIVGGEGPTVSLTSFGPRVRWTFLTLEAIGCGSRLPKRIILWLSSEDFQRGLPRSLSRLKKRGLEVPDCDDLGPHKKYYPYVSSADSNFDSPLVTADDDIDYSHSWLASLLRSHETDPEAVICHRGRVVMLSANGLEPYSGWPLAEGQQPVGHLMATGAGGVLYPGEMLHALRARGDGFRELCPRADDIWLHQTALRSGVPVRLVHEGREEIRTFAVTQRWSLKHENVRDHGNDAHGRAS